jgi:hypothetical protein
MRTKHGNEKMSLRKGHVEKERRSFGCIEEGCRFLE